jgi:hypothetical protein
MRWSAIRSSFPQSALDSTTAAAFVSLAAPRDAAMTVHAACPAL